MQLLMFSGNSRANQAWIHNAAEQFKDLFDSVYIQDYGHWASGDKFINMDHELSELAAKAPGFGSPTVVFAKSIGTVLTARAIEHGLIKPKFMMFCGLPLGYINTEYPQFAEIIAGYNHPTTIIHNVDDPVGSASAVQQYMSKAVSGMSQYKFVATPGDSHEYVDFKLMRDQLGQLNASRN